MLLGIRWMLLCVPLYYLFTEKCVGAYKPVFLIHGVLSDAESMLPMAQRINEIHPGTEMYVTSRYSYWSSLENMWAQVEDIGNDLMKLCSAHPEGIHLIGYSQGGLVARGILERFPNHTVHTFISLSSPQAGQYGVNYTRAYFPGVTRYVAYELFYSELGQHMSVGGYWNDPHHQALYLKYSLFLPYIDNILPSVHSTEYKNGFSKLRKLVLIGGPDDDIIAPWQSSHFAFYDEDENLVEMRQRKQYTEDTFGLKTLDKAKRLIIIEQSGVNHSSWNINIDVIDKYIIPYLD